MLDSIWKDVKREFNYGNMVTRIIIVNIAIFLLVIIVKLIFTVSAGFETTSNFRTLFNYLTLSKDLVYDITHPWVFFTHMFLHEGFFHILSNMLFLYWFGRIVGDFIGNQRVLPLYLLGGLSSAAAFLIFTNSVSHGSSFAHGASGAINAIVVAAAVISPDYIVRLLFFGDVKLKYIAAVVVLLSLIGIADGQNTGGQFGHLGGALFGWFFISRLREGQDFAVPINKFMDKLLSLFKRIPEPVSRSKAKKGPRMVYKNPNKQPTQGNSVSDTEDLSHQEQIDIILDKIKKTGYESLSTNEKEFLFNASKK